jgi:hypothetical protein
MWKAVLAGVVALAMTGPAVAADRVVHLASRDAGDYQEQGGPQVLTQTQIARFRAALKLRSEQERYWPAVARVLNSMIRQSGTSGSRSGLVRRIGERASALASDVTFLRQLAAAAMPLVRSMDDEQKLTAMRFVNAMGYGAVLAAF